MSTYAQGSGLVLDAPKSIQRTVQDERWSPPVATLVIVSTSLALWASIFFVVNLVVS